MVYSHGVLQSASSKRGFIKRLYLKRSMASRWAFWRKSENQQETKIINTVSARPSDNPLILAAGLKDIIDTSDPLREDSNWDNDFDIYDEMVKLDPELNGAVRTVSLTANNWSIDYKVGKNERIREAIRELVEDRVDFDDFLINAVRNLMVYGNDINKLVGRAGEGITNLQSLPVKQITIIDGRSRPFTAGKSDPIINADTYILRENSGGIGGEQVFPADEILHIRIDYRSNWFQDNLNRWTYGVWGASRFSSLKQPVRAKWNSINNRVSLEDALTKQFITISSKAVEHITDPDEQRDRLKHIMDEVVSTLEALRGDQVPIFPDFVEMHFVDTRNSLPDNGSFLDSVNSGISGVLHVPRVAAGQERGSTFSATFNANVWAVQAIQRLQQVVVQAVHRLFSAHLTMLGIPHRMRDIPTLSFNSVDYESDFDKTRRAVLGLSNGLYTLNQALDIVDLPDAQDGDDRLDMQTTSPGDQPPPPRQKEQGTPPTQKDNLEME